MRAKKARNQIIPAIIFLLPGFALLGIFFIGPLLYSFRISFFNWNFAHPDRSVFVGLSNYITQIKSRPPTFLVFGNRTDELPESYRRYLLNAMRRDLSLGPVPLRLEFRGSRNPYGTKPAR